MSDNLNLYIPGRPNYIYKDGVCYRKTDERTKDNGTIYDNSDVDWVSTTKSQFEATNKAIWIQGSCEECSDPGGIQMISVDWVGLTMNIDPKNRPLLNPNLGDSFFTIDPLRNRDYIRGSDDGDGDGVDDSIIGPGASVTITTEQVADFAEIFGAITPVKYGVYPPEAGRSDPLSAADGFYQLEDDCFVSVDLKPTGDIELLPGHPDYVNPDPTNPLDVYSIKPLSDGGGVTVSVTALSFFNTMLPGQEYNPIPTAPCIHETLQVPCFFAFNNNHNTSYRSSVANVHVQLQHNTTDIHKVTGVGENDYVEGGTSTAQGAVAVGDRWKKLISGGDPDNMADWEGDYPAGTSGARLFQVIGFRPSPSGSWNVLPDR